MARKIVILETRFRDLVMDWNPYFVVHEDMGNGTYRCVSEDDGGYGGVERFYSAQQIRARVANDEATEAMFNARNDYWASRTVGEILHYQNGFDQFVRGVVVLQDGEKRLKPTALVGKWSDYDLPRRSPNGEVYYPYHADKIVNPTDDSTWQPSEGCVFECPDYSYKDQSKVDPRELPEIDLTVPDMTAEEQAIARLEQALDRVRKLLEERYRTSTHPREVLESIKELIDEVSTPGSA